MRGIFKHAQATNAECEVRLPLAEPACYSAVVKQAWHLPERTCSVFELSSLAVKALERAGGACTPLWNTKATKHCTFLECRR